MRQTMNVRIGGPITPVVKNLLIINAVVFLFQQFAAMLAPGMLENLFGLNHQGLVHDFRFWQIASYMFLHGGWLHILFNLLGLWMFAGDLETHWGSRLFLRYYLFCGVGAGMFIAAMNYFVVVKYGTNPFAPYAPTTLGASGAIYGILLAYGLTWPNREVLLYFLIPVKMKYLGPLFRRGRVLRHAYQREGNGREYQPYRAPGRAGLGASLHPDPVKDRNRASHGKLFRGFPMGDVHEKAPSEEKAEGDQRAYRGQADHRHPAREDRARRYELSLRGRAREA
ncbi:MAG: rhomboid family intramembrane serine protease [Spirochaetales bacterium]|nr:MAG: rhomboid family intramembrane serine protease [Spirochaetales bacterium]